MLDVWDPDDLGLPCPFFNLGNGGLARGPQSLSTVLVSLLGQPVRIWFDSRLCRDTVLYLSLETQTSICHTGGDTLRNGSLSCQGSGSVAGPSWSLEAQRSSLGGGIPAHW
jgi:hypothetical protein